jgi:hypothetical protein
MNEFERYTRARKILNEAEWLTWDHPAPMCLALDGRVSARKARLFESACLRRLWHWRFVVPNRWAIVVLERDAVGQAAAVEILAAARALRDTREATTAVMGGMWNQAFSDMEDRDTDPWATAGYTCEAMNIAAGLLVRAAAGLEEDRPDEDQRLPEQRAQCDLLRCSFSNPFRPAPAVERTLLDKPGSLIAQLAQGAYDERRLPAGTLDPARLAILADALEEGGCATPEILAHLRAPGHHWRGCWCLDIFLGKS